MRFKHTFTTAFAQVLLAVALLSFPVSALTPEENYTERLEDLVRDYGIDEGEEPTFSEPFFNRLLGRARIVVGRAQRSNDRGWISTSAWKLARSVAILDRATNFGIAQNMSGIGHSDDLASFSRFILSRLFNDLLDEYAPNADVMILAYLGQLKEYAEGLDETREQEGDWAEAAFAFAWGITVIEWAR